MLTILNIAAKDFDVTVGHREIPIDITLLIMFNKKSLRESRYMFAGKDGDAYKLVERSFNTA